MAGDQTRAEYRDFNLHIARRDLPRTLVWLGGVLILFGTVDLVVPPHTPLNQFVGVLLLGSLTVAASYFLRRPGTPLWISPWVFAALLTAVVCWLLFIYVQEPIPSNLTYVIIATTFFGPLAFGWRPFLAASVVILTAVATAMVAVNLVGAVDWGIGILASLVTSGVLLSMRLQLLRELADSERRNALLSTSDVLTGLLNRRGLEERLPTLWADAARRGEPMRVCFLDVRGLKRANDEHGHDFGDLVIRDVADAIRATVRGGDLVARWGGDEFVTVGIGRDASVSAFRGRLTEHFVTVGRAQREDWSGDVTVGVAVAAADAATFDELLERADADMYDRRRPPQQTFG
jgi:diguanylate cyclase (GGDEF)-like protein